MTFADRIAQHPEIAVAGCITWIFIAVWIMCMLHWTIQGDIETSYGLIGIALSIGMGILVVNPPQGKEFVTPLVMFAVIGSVALFIPLRNLIDRHQLVAIDMDAIERAYQQLEERPNNVGARFKIAKLAYSRGLHGHAIKLADEALKNMPPDFFAEEHKIVDTWKKQAHDSSTFRPVPCVECGFSNAPGELYCKRCNAKFLLDQAKGKWIGRSMVRKLMAGWVALLGVFVGIPAAVAALQPEIAIVVIAGLCILVGTTLYAAFFINPTVRRT